MPLVRQMEKEEKKRQSIRLPWANSALKGHSAPGVPKGQEVNACWHQFKLILSIGNTRPDSCSLSPSLRERRLGFPSHISFQ